MSIYLDKEYNNAISADYRRAITVAITVAQTMGIDIFLIGGVVRDLILDNPIKDIDIAVQGDAINFAHELLKAVPCEIVNVQENLRTVKVKFQSNVVIDFASTRQEKYDKAGFLPEAYNFGCDLKDDVKRRDFSINTLALKLTGINKFSLIDHCKGYEDIKNKKIRILHDNSFIDDPSRIIRALKFKVRFNFKLEEYTNALMQEYLEEKINKNIPLTRIKNELAQYFNISNSDIYSTLIKSKAYKLICDNPIQSIDESKIRKLKKFDIFDERDIWYIYILALLVNSKYDETKLNLSNYDMKVLGELKKLLARKPKEDEKDNKIYATFHKLNELSIATYYILSSDKSVEKFLTTLKDIKVLITGKDLIDLGFIPSPKFAKIFEAVLKEKLNGKLKTKEDEINFLKKKAKKKLFEF